MRFLPVCSRREPIGHLRVHLPFTPGQNGIAERLFRSLNEVCVAAGKRSRAGQPLDATMSTIFYREVYKTTEEVTVDHSRGPA